MERLYERAAKLVGDVCGGASDNVLHHFVDDSDGLLPEFLYLLLPLVNLALVGVFLALLSVDLLLNEQLLLRDVLQLVFRAVVVSPSESLVCGVGDIAIRLGKLVGSLGKHSLVAG